GRAEQRLLHPLHHPAHRRRYRGVLSGPTRVPTREPPSPLAGKGERGARWAHAIRGRICEREKTLAQLGFEEWRRPCEGEGWPLGLVASHIGLGLDRQAAWKEEHAHPRADHALSWEETNELNAENARRRGLLSRMSALRFVRDRAEHIA